MDSQPESPLSTDPLPQRLVHHESKVHSQFVSWTDIYEENDITIFILPVVVIIATALLYAFYQLDSLSEKKDYITKKALMNEKKGKSEMKQKPESQAIQKENTKKTKSKQKRKRTTKKEHETHEEVYQVPKTNDQADVGVEELEATANATTSQMRRLPEQGSVKATEVTSSAAPSSGNLQEKGKTKTKHKQGETKEVTSKKQKMEEKQMTQEKEEKQFIQEKKDRKDISQKKLEEQKSSHEDGRKEKCTIEDKSEEGKNTVQKTGGRNTQKMEGRLTTNDEAREKHMAQEKHSGKEKKKTEEKQKTYDKRPEDRPYTRERKTTSIDWKEEVVRYTSMPIEEKRKMYLCGSNITKLADIPTLADQYQYERRKIQKGVSEHFASSVLSGKKYEADPELNTKVSLWKGDITTLEIDAIVNAANRTLLGGGGVDGAIHRAAGPSLKAECASLNGCNTGEAKITCGYKLPAKYVIHTVGPMGEIPGKLKLCYQNSLAILRHHRLRSVAFPCISTGVYGYPNEAACPVAIRTVRDFLQDNRDIERVIFCLFLPVDVSVYEKTLPLFFPEPPQSSQAD